MFAMKGIEPFEQVMIYIVLATAFIALAYAYWLRNQTFAKDKGYSLSQDAVKTTICCADLFIRHKTNDSLGAGI